MRVCVIGAGLAGLTAAIGLARRGIEVYVYTIDDIENTNSYKLQAGIAMPLMPYDSPELHVKDTLYAGKFINDVEMAWLTISKASEAYDFLLSLGIKFTSVEREGGHSVPRTFSIYGSTGAYLIKALIEKAKSLGVSIVKRGVASLIMSNGRCVGIVDHGGEEHYFDAVVMASGGYTAIYKKFTGSSNCLGLLIGDYLLHGGTLVDLEFVQFHPTVFIPKDGKAFLITEALRGRGAKIVDEKGRRFVDELAPRDVVVLEVYRRIMRGEVVYLDLRDVEDLPKEFPHVYETLRKFGLDPLSDLIPISPAAHYSIGGIKIDSYYRTEFKGLYAIGEIAGSGVHGANRLGGNSALECIVSGIEVVRTIIRDNPKLEFGHSKTSYYQPDIDKDELEILKETMWNYVGVIRKEDGLEKALRIVEGLKLPKQLKELAKGVIICAKARKESRGVHIREDHPYMDKSYGIRIKYRIKG